MSFPFTLQRSQAPSLPHPRRHHHALTWGNATLIWGGTGDAETKFEIISVVYLHLAGEWTRLETSGTWPRSSLCVNAQGSNSIE